MEDIAKLLLESDLEGAKDSAAKNYPFEIRNLPSRSYTKTQMFKIFMNDGFIDRYSGEKLYHPGFLRLMHQLLPDEFPFDAHGKMNKCHDVFWDLLPSVDHFISLYRGGKDEIGNYVTTSMKRNLAKNNWSIEELGWQLYPPGDFNLWDGQSNNFIRLVEKFGTEIPYIKEWYRITKKRLLSE